MKTKNRIFLEQGAVALPIVLILAAVLLTVGLAMNMSGNNKNNIAANKDRAQIAFYIAETGINDALEKITRNMNYSTNYTLAFNKGKAEIILNRTVPFEIAITSKGTFEDNIKTIETVFDIDANGKISKRTWKEL